jgi:sugar phosphate permease
VGQLGDKYKPKKVLILALAGLFLILFIIGIITQWINEGVLFYIFFFSISGILQATGWPTCLNIFTNWFGEGNRGVLTGFFTTCNNVGNIFGALITSFLVQTLNFNWHCAYATIGCFCLLVSVINAVFLVSHPREKNLSVDEKETDFTSEQLEYPPQ